MPYTITINHPLNHADFNDPWHVDGDYTGPDTATLKCKLRYPDYEESSDDIALGQGHWNTSFGNPANSPLNGSGDPQEVPLIVSDDQGSTPAQIMVVVINPNRPYVKPLKDTQETKSGQERLGRRRGHGGFGGQILINSPSPGANVSVTFSGSGTIAGCTNNVSGSITANGQTYPGTVAVAGPNWQISFAQPAAAGSALLQVWCTNDNTVIAQETINIVSGGGSGGTGGGGHYYD